MASCAVVDYEIIHKTFGLMENRNYGLVIFFHVFKIFLNGVITLLFFNKKSRTIVETLKEQKSPKC